jgi:hypothetical protein
MIASADAEILTILNVYHQRPGRDPISIGDGTFTSLHRLRHHTPSQVVRSMTVGREWTRVDGENEMVLLRNMEGMFLDKIPSDEDRERMAQRVLEVSFIDCSAPIIPVTRPMLVVHPGSPQQLFPPRGVTVALRARTGSVEVDVMTTPAR